jgi:hypothetical protein
MLQLAFSVTKPHTQDTRKLTLMMTLTLVADTQFTPAGHEFVDRTFKSAAASFLSIYLSLPRQQQTLAEASRSHVTPLELTGTILDKLSSPQGRQLVVAAVGAFTSAATPIVVSQLCSKQHLSGDQQQDLADASHAASHGQKQPHVVEIVLEWLTHPASKDQAEALLSSVASKTAAAAVGAAMNHGAVEGDRKFPKFSYSHVGADEEDKHVMLGGHVSDKVMVFLF